jgi:hypothetical protein
MTERVATANIRVTLGPKAAREALDKVLPHADLIGLQEWGNSRAGILASTRGFAWVKPCPACPPVGARLDRYTSVEARKVVLAWGRRVNPVPGRRGRLPDCNATLAVFSDDDGEVAVLNIHLPAHVEKGSHYRRILHRLTPRARMHRQAVSSITKIESQQKAKGRRVYVIGDTNYHLMPLPLTGLRSCWTGNRHPGTLGARTVDQVYAAHKPTSVRTIRTASDHDAVVVTYR